MIVAENALQLAGFLLVHAMWVSSELKEGELYVPQVLCESGEGDRELFVFEAPTQYEAVDKAKQFLQTESHRFARCAFARDGRTNPGNGYVDVLIVDIIEGNEPSKLTVIQPYKPAVSGHFQLLGEEFFLAGGAPLSSDEVAVVTSNIRQGAESHQGANMQWLTWNAERDTRNPLR